MPIPSMYPRTIPSGQTTRRQTPQPKSYTATARPGSSVPRKSAFTLDKSDWRGELASTEYAYSPRSLPMNTTSGVRVIDANVLIAQRVSPDNTPKREVQLEGLIENSRGKREKRVTTATSLGFDFIPNPSILPLPDTMLSHTLGRSSPALSNTPSTPALLPAHHRGLTDDDDNDVDDIDEWEHLSTISRGDEDEDDDVDSQSEADVIVLGELELEDELDLADHRRETRHAAKQSQSPIIAAKSSTKVTSTSAILPQGIAKRGVSYAAALGMK